MTSMRGRDRLRRFIDVILESLDDHADGAEVAQRAYLSRFHFDRVVAAALRESPGKFRRRLLLERAAFELGFGDRAVTDIAIDAGYASSEAFGRAFRRAFAASPSGFRDGSGTEFRLPSPNDIHFHPPGGLVVPADSDRRNPMDLTDRMIEHDLWLTRRLLDRAARLQEEDLDGPAPRVFDEATIREHLNHLVFSKEVWSASIAGRPAPDEGDRTIEGMRARLETAGTEFAELVRGIRDRAEWDTAFVDALCDPPESFTYGSMVAHVLTWSAARRFAVISALHDLGVDDVGIGDPIEWERSAAEG